MNAPSITPALFRTLATSLSELCPMATSGCSGDFFDDTPGMSHEFSDVSLQWYVPGIIGTSRSTEVAGGIPYALTLRMAIPAKEDNWPRTPKILSIPIWGERQAFPGRRASAISRYSGLQYVSRNLDCL